MTAADCPPSNVTFTSMISTIIAPHTCHRDLTFISSSHFNLWFPFHHLVICSPCLHQQTLASSNGSKTLMSIFLCAQNDVEMGTTILQRHQIRYLNYFSIDNDTRRHPPPEPDAASYTVQTERCSAASVVTTPGCRTLVHRLRYFARSCKLPHFFTFAQTSASAQPLSNHSWRFPIPFWCFPAREIPFWRLSRPMIK